jgi:hypothetical protein
MDTNYIKQNGQLVVESKIDDDFEGFDDEMLFSLFNGQYWIQKTYKYWYHYAYMPNIKIYALKGTHYLTIEGQIEFVEVKQISEVIEATITNDFNGWSGDTIFELDNGQVWQQNEYDYQYNYSYRPKAIIYDNGYGHKILVEGEKVGIKRIK